MNNLDLNKITIVVIIPCFNEGKTIRHVVKNFQQVIPSAIIYVYDNNSIDNTISEAKEANAIVRKVTRQGKGNVVRRMFADIDADLYILVDGDGTYESKCATKLIQTILDGPYDMVNTVRVSQDKKAYPFGHNFGNKLLNNIVSYLFATHLSDMLSGYRIFSKRFVKSFPTISEGFEIETELTIHALALRMPIAEINTPYYARPADSYSKLSTHKDGFRILYMIISLLRKERPLFFFSSLGIFLGIVSFFIGWPIILNFFHTGLVPRLPSAVLAASLAGLGFLSLVCGLILDAVSRGIKETKQLAYLSFSIPKTNDFNEKRMLTPKQLEEVSS